jgi:phosphoglycerate dehydrogenase-like enzyme
VLDESVADNAFALLLCLAKNTCKANAYIKSGEWRVRDPFKFMGVDVWGKTAGIIGLGRIGGKIAERARGFKMKILYYDIFRKPELEKALGVYYVALDRLLREADFIFISTLLTEETRGMIGEEELSKMKRTAMLINVARGPIVRHEALVRALREGWIAGAGLDVFDHEPLPLDDPLIGLENVVLTPHISSNTIECRKRLAVTVAEEVLRVLHGESPRYAVNPEAAQIRI